MNRHRVIAALLGILTLGTVTTSIAAGPWWTNRHRPRRWEHVVWYPVREPQLRSDHRLRECRLHQWPRLAMRVGGELPQPHPREPRQLHRRGHRTRQCEPPALHPRLQSERLVRDVGDEHLPAGTIVEGIHGIDDHELPADGGRGLRSPAQPAPLPDRPGRLLPPLRRALHGAPDGPRPRHAAEFRLHHPEHRQRRPRRRRSRVDPEQRRVARSHPPPVPSTARRTNVGRRPFRSPGTRARARSPRVSSARTARRTRRTRTVTSPPSS